VVAVYLPAIALIPVEPLAGKVVIGTMNYIPELVGRIEAIEEGATTAVGVLQAHLPRSRVVCGFSMVDAGDVPRDGHPKGDPRRRALALAGDDVGARQVVAELYDEFGFDALDIGDLQASWRIAPGQPAFVAPQNLAQLQANVALRAGSRGSRGWRPKWSAARREAGGSRPLVLSARAATSGAHHDGAGHPRME
jgi:predicted dinucleotide-binding enzyme